MREEREEKAGREKRKKGEYVNLATVLLVTLQALRLVSSRQQSEVLHSHRQLRISLLSLLEVLT